jgi:hypothetical protein
VALEWSVGLFNSVQMFIVAGSLVVACVCRSGAEQTLGRIKFHLDVELR